MTKIELMETYTVEQLAEMVEKRTPFTDEELIQKWKTLAEEFHNGYCKALEEIDRLQSEVEKYRKAFEHAKNERDCQIAEYRKKIEELKQKLERQETATKYAEEYVDSLKNDLERSKNTINQIDDILEKLFGVRYDTVDKPDEFGKILSDKAKGNIADFLPTEPIKVVDMLINASKKRINCMTGKEYDKYIFEKWQLKQIAEHLLVYCNHNGEVEE